MFSNQWNRIRSLHKNVRNLTDMVRIVEVGPRDGLQNVSKILPASTKIELINRLSETGLRSIEVTSFVSAKWVPQMGDNVEVFQGIKKNPNIEYSVLVPNIKGLEKALELGVKEVVLFNAASETFSQKNTNCSIEESLDKFREIRKICREKNVATRGIISCIAGCPYEGDISPSKVAQVAEALLEMGCYEVGLGDTTGVATPKKIKRLFEELRKMTGGDVWRFAMHCHDTYGMALANIYESLNQGIRVFDSSVAGLGGCPYSPGATGNVSTEDLVYLLHEQGLQTGIDLDKLIEVGNYICEQIPTTNHSKIANVVRAKKSRSTGQ